MKRTIITLLAAAALCVPLAGKEPEEFLLGAGFHFGSHTGDIEANLDIASRIGLNAGRDERLWNAVEWNKGEYVYGNFVEKAYTQAARRGLAMIFILAYGNRHYDNGNYPVRPETAEAFCRFAEHTARHFGDRAEFFQVWNEWEGSTSMPAQFKDTGTSEAYVKFLKQVAPRIRAAAPQARIVANSISSGDRCLDYYLKNGSMMGAPPPWSSMSPFAAMCSTEKLPSAALFSSRSGRETNSLPVGIYLADIGRPRNLI